MTEDNGHRVRLSNTAIGITLAVLAQAGGLIIWATTEHNSRVTLQERVIELERRATELNRAQDTQLARIDESLRALNDKQNVINTSDSARIDNINGHLTRMDDRVEKVVQALDSTYNLINAHIRDHNKPQP